MKNAWRIFIWLLFAAMTFVSVSRAGEIKSIRGGYLQNDAANSAAIRDLKKNALKKIHEGNRRNWARMNMTTRYNEKTLTQPNKTPAFIGKKHNIAIEDIISTRNDQQGTMRGIKRAR